VDSAISPASAMYGYMMSENLRDRCFNFFLDCAVMLLSLPAMKVSTQVLNYQGYSLSLCRLVAI
jgi:hypothetical protein